MLCICTGQSSSMNAEEANLFRLCFYSFESVRDVASHPLRRFGGLPFR